MDLKIIAAVAENNVIGNRGRIPWYLPDDFKHFKRLTMGHPVIMGQVTFESIERMIGKPLPGRTNLVLSDNPNFSRTESGVIICRSLDAAIAEAEKRDSIAYIGGGSQVYRQTIRDPRTTGLEITEVHCSPEGDSFFPEINPEIWREVIRSPRGKYSFVTYKRT